MPVCHGSPSLAFAQARWRQLRSCAGALESIIWAYRTRVAPFEPDALHPNADDDKAERTLHLELVEWRQGLAAGADLNSTTLRRGFPGSVFKHGQRRPKADSFWQRQMSWLQRQMSWLIMTWTYLICCGKRSWTDAAQAKAHANAQEDKDLKTQAYCAPPDLQPQKSRSPTRNKCYQLIPPLIPCQLFFLQQHDHGCRRCADVCYEYIMCMCMCMCVLCIILQEEKDQRGMGFAELLLIEWKQISTEDKAEWETEALKMKAEAKSM